MRTRFLIVTMALSVLLSLLLSLPARAGGDDTLSLETRANAEVVKLGETFQLDVVLTVKTQGNVEELTLPELGGAFTVVGQQRSSSTSVSASRGQNHVELVQKFVLLLRADQPGTHTIGEATARLGTHRAKSSPLSIKVEVTGSDDDTATTAPDKSSGHDPGARFKNGPPTAFLDVHLDKDTAIVGEPLPLRVELYTQMPLSEWPRMEGLQPPGFLCEMVPLPRSTSSTQRTVNGKPYYVYLVSKNVLFPVAAGNATVPAIPLEVTPSSGFFQQSRTLTVKSEPVVVHVTEAPTEGKPSTYTGVVGEWHLEARVSSLNTHVGEPVTLQLRASGRGNLSTLKLPAYESTSSTRVFPPNVKVERDDNGEGIGGRVTSEMLVQPTNEGDLHVPSFAITSYNPRTAQYEESRTEPITVHVLPAQPGAAMTTTTGPTAGNRQTLGRGVRPLCKNAVARATTHNLPLWCAGLALCAGLASFATGTLRARRRSSTSGQQAVRKKAREHALHDAAASGDLAAVQRLVLEAVEDASGVRVQGLPHAQLQDALAATSVRDDVTTLVRVLKDAEAARYAPGGGERARVAQAAHDLVRTVDGRTP